MRQGARTLIPIDFSGLPTKYPYTLVRFGHHRGAARRAAGRDWAAEVWPHGDCRRTATAWARPRSTTASSIRARASWWAATARTARCVNRPESASPAASTPNRSALRLRPALRRGARRRSLPVLCDERPERAGTAARWHPPHRRAEQRARGAIGRFRPGHHGRSRLRPDAAFTSPSWSGDRDSTHIAHRVSIAIGPDGCCSLATRPTCTAPSAGRA